MITTTLPHITKKQHHILILLYRFRFLDRILIQQLLNHKDYKTINRWLKDLTEKNYITRKYEHTFEGKTKPAIYSIALNGIRYLRTQETVEKSYIKKLYKEPTKSDSFIKKSLFIGQMYTYLLQSYASKLTFYTQSDLPITGEIHSILPSFGYEYKKGSQRITYVCEILGEKQPVFYMKQRIKKFLEFFDGESVKLLFITPTQELYNRLSRFILKECREQDYTPEVFFSDIVSLTTYGIIEKQLTRVELE